MRTVLWSFLAFILGLVAGWSVSVGYYLAATTWFGVFDRDGGGAMGAVFILGPALGLLFGTIAATVTAVRMSGRRRADPPHSNA